MSKKFPANSVISSYVSTENMLKDILQIVPYCDEHENVWSPKLVTIILESCSQLDSLWKSQALSSSCVTKTNLNISDYFEFFGEKMSKRWVVFYGESSQQICPFDNWSKASDFKANNYSKYELKWWNTYNKLKHDRLQHLSKAILKDAVLSLAGLFVAIIKCEYCRDAIAQTGWLNGNDEPHYLSAWLTEDSPSVKLQYVSVESSLFTYPVGWCEEKVTKGFGWGAPVSTKFLHWFEQYEK
jgi:hypothetical protein